MYFSIPERSFAICNRCSMQGTYPQYKREISANSNHEHHEVFIGCFCLFVFLLIIHVIIIISLQILRKLHSGGIKF